MMKTLIDQYDAPKKPRKGGGHTHRRKTVPVHAAASAQKTRDQWVRRLEAARQTALNFNMRSMSPDDISREILLRRGELP